MRVTSEAALEASLARRRTALVYASGFLYALSLHKYLSRDALSGGGGVQGFLEFGFTMGALVFTFVALRSTRRRFPPSGALVCFALFGLFALASSWRSFNPALSLAKGLLYFAVLEMGYLAGQAGYFTRLFRGIYWTYTGSIIVGVFAGLAMPARFPLWTTDEFTGRSRFSVFGTFPGTMGETAAYLILLAPLIFRRPHWISRGLLLLANLLAGGKTSTVLLLGLLGMEYILKIRGARSWRAIGLVSALTCCFGALTYSSVIRGVDPASIAGDRLSNLYGHDVAAEAVSLDGRLSLWQGSFAVMVENPLLGYGVDGARDVMFKLASWSGSTHNGFLDLGIDGGIVALCFFMMGLTYVLRACMSTKVTLRSQLLLVFSYMFAIAWTGITFSFPSFFGLLVLVLLLFRAKESTMEFEVTQNAEPVMLNDTRMQVSS